MADIPPGFEDLRASILPAIGRYLDAVSRWACLGGQVEEIERRYELGRRVLDALLTEIVANLRNSNSGSRARELMQRVEEWIAARPRNLDFFLEGTLQEPDVAKRRHTANHIAACLDLSVEDTELLARIIEGGYQANMRRCDPTEPPPDGSPF